MGYSRTLVPKICDVLQFTIFYLPTVGCAQHWIRWTITICSLHKRIVNIFRHSDFICLLSNWSSIRCIWSHQLVDASEKFSAAFMIINLIVRVVTSIYLLRIGQARGGSLATMFTSCPPMGIARQDYEDISHSIPQNSDFVGI